MKRAQCTQDIGQRQILARIIRERFCSNRGFAAFVREASFLKREAQEGRVCLYLFMRDTRYASRGTRFGAISQRTVMNNAGWAGRYWYRVTPLTKRQNGG